MAQRPACSLQGQLILQQTRCKVYPFGKFAAVSLTIHPLLQQVTVQPDEASG